MLCEMETEPVADRPLPVAVMDHHDNKSVRERGAERDFADVG